MQISINLEQIEKNKKENILLLCYLSAEGQSSRFLKVFLFIVLL